MNCNKNSFSISNPPPLPIFLGYPGENDTRPVSVDVSAWLEEFPDGTVSIVYTRADKLTYLVVVNDPGPVVTWKPNHPDLVTGSCRLQAQIQQGDDVKKDCIVDCVVGESLDDPNDPPEDPQPTYVEQVIDAADRAEDAVEHYPQIRDGYWWVWDIASGEWVNTGVKATGEGGGAVESVNGMTGAVVLDADNVGALPNTYVAPVQSVNGKTGVVNLDAQDVGAVDSDTYATDMAQVNNALQDKISTDDLATALDDVGGITYVLALNGATVTLDRPFVAVANSLLSTARRVMFVVILAESGGNPVEFLSLTPTLLDTNNRLLTLVGEHNGSRYTAKLTAASASSTMTGTLVVEPIVTETDVQTAIAGIQTHDPRVAMASTDTTATLNPNTLYVFPEMASLTITLAPPADTDVVNEYHFIFTSGATATTLSIPATVNQPDGFSVDANMIYEVSILEGNMTAMSWEVTA